MKKLISLALALTLVFCLATAVSAVGDRYVPEMDENECYVLTMEGDTAILVVEAGGMPNLKAAEGATISIYGMESESGNDATYTLLLSGANRVMSEAGNASGTMVSETCCLWNTSEVEVTFYINVTAPAGGGSESEGPEAGTVDNPIDLNEAPLGEYTATSHEVVNPMLGMTMNEPTYYKWVSDVTGLLVLTVDNANETGWSYTINNLTSCKYGDYMNSAFGTDPYIYVVPVSVGDELQIMVGTAQNLKDETVKFSLTAVIAPDAEIFDPAQLNATDIDVPANSFVVYSISSMLNDRNLIVDGEDSYVVVNNTLSNTLTGTPSNIVIIANTGDTDATFVGTLEHPAGSEGNPIRIENVRDMTGIDAVPGETYYAISAMLAGKELFIAADENLKFYLNGTELVAGADGMIFAEIVPAGPFGAQLKVVNETDAEIETMAGIQDPLGSEGNPIVITPMAGETTVETAAGAATYLVVPAMCNGNYLVIEGEGLTVTVNGTAVEAKSGLYAVELTGVPSNSVVIENAGEAAATYTVSLSATNPATGDNSMLSAAAALLLVSACAIALIGKKKEF